MFLDVCNRLALEPDCIRALQETYEKIRDHACLRIACDTLIAGQTEQCEEAVAKIVEDTGVIRSTAVAAMLIVAVPQLKQAYAEKGVPEELMWDTLVDLKCKLTEQHDLIGVWGTGSIGWYIRVYGLKIIKLGRLEFEPIGYKWDTPYRGIQKGDPVMNMHIPSTGPMKIEDVLDSFKQAYRFYGYTEPMPVAAASWLLYPPVCEEVLKPGSNLKNFYELFDVVEQYEDPTNHNFWRIFNVHWEEGVLDKVPLDTSLRRDLHAFMKPGRDMGVGRCMLLFDGEKVISK